MEEFKVAYNHDKAIEIIQKVGGKFMKREILEDLYLVDDGQNIWKLARTDNKIQLVYLQNRGNRFEVGLRKEIEKGRTCDELNQLFNESKGVMRKERRHYRYKNSEIVLDEIKELGQFIEFYPIDDTERQKLFEFFHIKSKQLIGESYKSLRIQK